MLIPNIFFQRTFPILQSKINNRMPCRRPPEFLHTTRIYHLGPFECVSQSPAHKKSSVLNTIIHELTMVRMRSHGLYIQLTSAPSKLRNASKSRLSLKVKKKKKVVRQTGVGCGPHKTTIGPLSKVRHLHLLKAGLSSTHCQTRRSDKKC